MIANMEMEKCKKKKGGMPLLFKMIKFRVPHYLVTTALCLQMRVFIWDGWGLFTWEKSPNCHCTPTVFPANPFSKVPMVVLGQLTDECFNCLSQRGSLLNCHTILWLQILGFMEHIAELLTHCTRSTNVLKKKMSEHCTVVCIFKHKL